MPTTPVSESCNKVSRLMEAAALASVEERHGDAQDAIEESARLMRQLLRWALYRDPITLR